MNKVILSLIGISIIIAVIFFSLNSKSKENTIVIGSRNFPEQYILGEMLAQLIEEYTDLEVEKNFGYTLEEINELLLEGKIDLYPEYTGTGWGAVLEKVFIYNPDILYQEVKKAYDQEFDIKWLERYGFNNSYGLAMKNDKAIEDGILVYSDLTLKSRLQIFGSEIDFYTRKDGYPGLVEKYDFEFKDNRDFDNIIEKYQAINDDEVDVIDVFTTDGMLEKYDLLILNDDQNYFPPYEAATIIRNDTLERYPELITVLNKLGGQITNEEMSRLNYLEVNSDMETEEIARLFLQSKGLIQ